MKSLEEVIEYKYRFMSSMDDPLYLFPTLFSSSGNNLSFDLFETKNNFDATDGITLLKEITPLLV